MSYNKMQYVTASGKVRTRTMPNGNEKSMLHTVLKDAVNIYTPMVKGLLHPQLVTERPVGVREKVLAFRKNQKAGFINEANKNQGVIVKKDIGTGGWILEMTGKIYLESQFKDRAEMEGKNSHHLYDGIRLGKPKESIFMSVWEQEIVGMYVRRSCRPTCELRHLFATELHLIVVARKPLKKGEEVTIAFELDCLGFNSQSKCASHERNPEDCPLEKNLLLRKAQKENPAAYSTVVTITDSDEEIETIVRRQPELVESSGPSSSNASSRPSPNVPKNPPVLRDSEIPGSSNRENVNNFSVAQVPMPTPNPVDPAVIFVQDPLLLRDPNVMSPPAPRLIFRLRSFSSSPSGSENADSETAPEPMGALDTVDPSAAPDLLEPEEAAAPVDVAAVPETAIPVTHAPSTRTRRRSMRLGQSAIDLTEPEETAAPVNVAGQPIRVHHRSRLQNADPEPAPEEPMDAREAAAHEPEEVAAPVDVADVPATATAPQTRRRLRASNGQPAAPDLTEPEQVDFTGAAAQELEEAAAPVDVATPAPQTRRRRHSVANGRPAMRTRQPTALNPPETAATPANVASARPTRAHHRATKKTGSSKKTGAAVARVQNRRSRNAEQQEENAGAVTLPRTARSIAGSEAADDAPIAPPARRKNRPVPAASAAPTAPAVVDLPTTRSRCASQALSSVAPDSTRRRPTSRSDSGLAPRSDPRAAPGQSAPPATRASRSRRISIGPQEAIALVAESMYPKRGACRQLRDKATNGAQGSTSDAPAAKKPRKTPAQQQLKGGRGGKK